MKDANYNAMFHNKKTNEVILRISVKPHEPNWINRDGRVVEGIDWDSDDWEMVYEGEAPSDEDVLVYSSGRRVIVSVMATSAVEVEDVREAVIGGLERAGMVVKAGVE